MRPRLGSRWLWTSGCLAALLCSGCAHWGWKHAGREDLGEVVDGSEVSFVETPLAKPAATEPLVQQPAGVAAATAATTPITRSAEDEALINDTLARLRTLPDMKPEQVDAIARDLRNPNQPVPRLFLQQFNAMAKLKQEEAKKQAEKAVAPAEATQTAPLAKAEEAPPAAEKTAVVKASAAAETAAPAPEPTKAEQDEAEPEAPGATPASRLLDRVRRARETTEEEAEAQGIFGGKVGANVAPRLEPEMLAMAHVAQKPATDEEATAEAAPPELAWDKHLAEAITGLEEALENEDFEAAEATRRAAQLRLLYLAADRQDEALREMAGLDPAEQDYWSHQLHSLSISLDAEGTPVKGRRAALALRPLREAVDHLAAQATLDVKNVALCKSVTIWGNYQEFDEYTFKPNQEVLLYFEVENFASQQTSEGHATEFISSYEIFDGSGRRVAEQQFPTAQETCKNRRRDYFIRYHFHVPKTLSAGEYTLQLTVEDQKGHKFGQGSVKFKVSA